MNEKAETAGSGEETAGGAVTTAAGDGMEKNGVETVTVTGEVTETVGEV